MPAALHWSKVKSSKDGGSRFCLTHSRSTLPVSMCSDNTRVTEAGPHVCLWRRRGRPVRKWTRTPPAFNSFEEPLMDKPPLNGNFLPQDTSVTRFFTLFGQQGSICSPVWDWGKGGEPPWEIYVYDNNTLFATPALRSA